MDKLKFTCISDTHNKHKQMDIGEGDVLIHAGDATGRGESEEIIPFLNWFSKQKFLHKILIAGNHDFGFEKDSQRYEQICKDLGIIYLNDSGVTIEGINIWGSPVQPEFCNWAFNRRIDQHVVKDKDIDYYHVYPQKIHPWIKPHWDLIPEDTHILITHGPALGILDEVRDFDGTSRFTGCPHLMDAIKKRKILAHIFGHIHEQYGVLCKDGVYYINASQLNRSYMHTNSPIFFEIDLNKTVIL